MTFAFRYEVWHPSGSVERCFRTKAKAIEYAHARAQELGHQTTMTVHDKMARHGSVEYWHVIFREESSGFGYYWSRRPGKRKA